MTGCCHKTRLKGDTCPAGRICPYDLHRDSPLGWMRWDQLSDTLKSEYATRAAAMAQNGHTQAAGGVSDPVTP